MVQIVANAADQIIVIAVRRGRFHEIERIAGLKAADPSIEAVTGKGILLVFVLPVFDLDGLDRKSVV